MLNVEFSLLSDTQGKAQGNKALIKPLYGAIDVRVVSRTTLIAMKELAGHEQDRIDMEHLRMRLEDDATS